MTLDQFLSDAELRPVLLQLASAGKIFAATLSRAALDGMLGVTGAENVQGEATKKLDLFGNETVVAAFGSSGPVAAMVSEEEELAHHLCDGPAGRYVVSIDPLDGSSNSDINGAVGTIFGIQRRKTSSGKASLEDMLRKGSEQVAAGYIMYGPSTIFVFTTGQGTNGFTLDTASGSWVLSHPSMKCPRRGKYYSANLGNAPQWDPRLRSYLEYMTASDKASGRPYSLRYVGALVADVHRSLVEGGIYFYPADSKHTTGKLRLLYECAPLAFVVEQAGGAASTGTGRILDVQATSIHQRVPIAIGSVEDVGVWEKFVRDGKV